MNKRKQAVTIYGREAVDLAILTVEMCDADAAYTILSDMGEDKAAEAVEFLYFE